MSDMGVINIINNRTGKKYTAGSTNIDQLMKQYKNKIQHASHHNEDLSKDAEMGDTFRFEVVSRNCKTEDEIRTLRDEEIYRNRNNTYNKDVNIYFDGGNPNAEFPQGKGTEKLNNVEDFTYSHTLKKTKKPKRDAQKEYEEYAKKLRESNSLKNSGSRRSSRRQQINRIRFGGKKTRNSKKEKTEREREREEEINKKNLIAYVDKFKSSTSEDLRNEIIKDINDKKITNKTQIVKRVTKELDISSTYKTTYSGKTTIVNFKERQERKKEEQEKKKEKLERKRELKRKELFKYLDKFKSSISDDLRNEIINDINIDKTITKTEIFKRVNEERKNKKTFREEQKSEDENKAIINIQELGLKEDLYEYVDKFPISEELKEELKLKIDEEIIINKPQIARIAIEARKNKQLNKEIEEIDIESSKLKKQIQDLEEKLDKLENDKSQLKKEYLLMDEETYKLEYKKIFELEKSSLGEKSRLNRRFKQLGRKRKRIMEE